MEFLDFDFDSNLRAKRSSAGAELGPGLHLRPSASAKCCCWTKRDPPTEPPPSDDLPATDPSNEIKPHWRITNSSDAHLPLATASAPLRPRIRAIGVVYKIFPSGRAY